MKLLSFLLMVSSTIGFCQTNPPVVLKIVYSNHIYLKARINNQHNANLLLDSGADEVLLDSTYFVDSKILFTRSQMAQLPGAGTVIKTIRVILDRMDIRFDTIVYNPRYVPLLDLRSIVGQSADGIISTSFMHPYLVEIDYANEVIKLHNDRTIIEDLEVIKMTVENNRYYLPMTIQAKDGLAISGKFQLDLGNGGTVPLTSPAATEYKLESNISGKLKYYNVNGGAGGKTEGYQFRALSLQIGKAIIKSPYIDWSIDQKGSLAKREYTGLLGNEILERFYVYIDFNAAILYLKPRSNLNDHFASNPTGLSFVNKSKKSGSVMITGIFQGGNAEKAGLKVHDEIISIKGRLITAFDDKLIDLFLRRPGKPVMIEIKRGDDIIKLELLREEIL